MSEAKRPVSVMKIIFTLCQLISITAAVTVNNADGSHNLDQFKYCMRQASHPSLRECVGRTAISFLQRFDEKDNYTLLDNFVSMRDDKIAARSLVNFLDTDPVDFRGILENAGAVFSQRSLEWHMDGIYPGLMLKIGPTASATSLAEFVLDPTLDERNFGYEEPSTARILAKQYLVPFLLGLKFNLVALVPLLFAVVCLLLKKSLFFAKLAIYVSSLLGVGGAVGALSSVGGFSGLGGLFGGFLPPPPPLPHVHGHAHSLDGGAAAAAAVSGYFPGKTTVFNHYSESDELHHNSPYKRNDRKVNFDKPRDYMPRSTPTSSTSAVDRFYEYEKQVLMQDRSSSSGSSSNTKLRTTNGKLGPSAYEDEDELHGNQQFKPSRQLGWKVVDLNT